MREVAKGMTHSKAYQPVFLIVTIFCTATIVLKFQPFGQNSSLKHFLLFGQAVFSIVFVICCCHLILHVWWDDCYWCRLHQRIEMKMFTPIGSCTVGTKHFTYQCIHSKQTCIEFTNKYRISDKFSFYFTRQSSYTSSLFSANIVHQETNNSIVTNSIWNLYLQHPWGIEVKNIILKKCPRDSIVWWFFSVSVPTSIWPHKVMLIYTEAWVILLLPSFPIPSLERLLMLPLSLLALELLLLLSLSLPSLELLHYSLIKIPVWKSSNDLGSSCFQLFPLWHMVVWIEYLPPQQKNL